MASVNCNEAIIVLVTIHAICYLNGGTAIRVNFNDSCTHARFCSNDVIFDSREMLKTLRPVLVTR
jgi:hypothetical protein